MTESYRSAMSGADFDWGGKADHRGAIAIVKAIPSEIDPRDQHREYRHRIHVFVSDGAS